MLVILEISFGVLHSDLSNSVGDVYSVEGEVSVKIDEEVTKRNEELRNSRIVGS